MNDETRSQDGLAWATVISLVLAYVLCAWRAEPPPLVLRTAPAGEFSGERALDHLVRIEGTGRPHPIGSAENARVRNEIVSAFQALGITAEVDERLTLGDNEVIAVTRNIVARLPGTGSQKSILVCAHHDSMPAGPGSSDDGAGVAAALELARALAALPQRERDVVFLIDDGEEAGLIGARAFLRQSPLAANVGVVVNLEARGTHGRAHMFETSTGNRELIAAYGRGVPHPSASSVAYELYQQMPNDTDLTVFKSVGLQGLNFAFIGGVSRYHTPLDDVAHLDPRSLQHIGESALGAVVELMHMDLEAEPTGDALYADVLGWTLLRFPAWLGTVLAVLVLAVCARNAMKRGNEPRRRWIRSVCAVIAGCVATIGAAHAIAWSLQSARGAMFPWTAEPLWTRIAVLLGSFACGAAIVRLIAKRADQLVPVRRTAWLLAAIAGVVLAFTMPSASYLFVFPALAAALVMPLERSRPKLALLVPVWIGALFVWPVTIGVEDGFGYGAPPGVFVACMLLFSAPAFVAGCGRVLALAGVTALVALVVALRVPCFDEHSPAWLNIVHEHDARAGTARWIAVPVRAPMPAELQTAGKLTRAENAFEGRFWTGARAGYVAEASAATVPPPRLDVIGETRDGAGRTVRARLWSPRGAVRFVVRAPKGVELRAVERGSDALRADASDSDSLIDDLMGRGRQFRGFDWRGSARFVGIDAAGVVLELHVASTEPVDIELVDISSDMPAEFETLARARPPHYVPRGEGDVSVIHERVRL